ncbi:MULTISPECIES: hypothetical protein [Streptomyces]|uniref:Heavy metal-binding domain-containing protein n=1 Tax=Streptomyces antibioticus TaxID=1890 RepID=A0AAE6Y5Z0_STRAT|nr:MULTISPECIES: hypothetical protein [Streptomyces]GLV95133.1 hypothetical protein Slala04_65860 [Streptomyces lavendulae subsp. lavendulae]KOU18333.1 hypothetical protein ADK49_12865 [Streptomyces sp. WM6349]KOV50545.1 hypothetical protein ADK98_08670 [Streptomyces sp. H036]MCX5167390.1 hypothetical protein [Streptomyces antibioticus]OOQ54031.1 hypothetical protein AFM16_05365 [Streptomyces antibioticus]
MNTAGKIGLFGAALAATFTSAYALGSVTEPLTDRTATAQHATHTETEAAPNSTALPSGLQVSQDGYSLDLQTPRLAGGQESSLRFAIKDNAGKAVTDFTTAHDKELHLIVASRDLNTFRHLHPTRAGDGTWSTPVNLPAAGDYRVFADFTPAKKGATALTLGTDLAVSGTYQPHELPAQQATAEIDGYTVTLDGNLTTGKMSDLTLNVTKDGKPVTDLEPYLGAYGHLVALRAGDLAYLHVHPEGEPGDGTTKPGPAVSFMATAPTNGAYRLFLDFKHQGTVRTAAFTVHTTATTAQTDSNDGHADHGTAH